MKYIPLLLLMLPFYSFGQSYNYYGVVKETVGSDYFKTDKVIPQEVSGRIILNEKSLTVDNRSYKLKKKERWLYKTKGGYVKLKYHGKELRLIQLVKYNTTIYYYIKNDGIVATRE